MGQHERITFRLIQCPECNVLLCCVNPRFYNYCPECGKFIFDRIRGCVLAKDENATISWREGL